MERFLTLLAFTAHFLIETPSIAQADSDLDLGSRLGRPLTMSLYQPLIGLRDALMRVQVPEDVFAEPAQWQPFFTSDVWVFAMGNWQEANMLGPVPRQAFDLRSCNSDAAQRVDVTLTDRRRVAVFFFDMSGFAAWSNAETSCQTAAIVSSQVLAWTDLFAGMVEDYTSYRSPLDCVSAASCSALSLIA